MKKIFALFIGAVLLVSCNKDKEVEIVYQLTAEITMSDVIKNNKNLDGRALYGSSEPLWSSEKVALMFNIYDQSGKLVSSDDSTYSNFLSRPTIIKALQEGNYTVVAIAYIKEMEDSKLQYWEFSNKDQLQEFKVEDKGLVITGGENTAIFGVFGSVLGVLKQEVDVTKSVTYQFNIPPSTSLICINFIDMHLSSVKYVDVMKKTANDYYDVSEQKGNVFSRSNRYTMELEKDDSYSNVRAYLNYFPTSDFDIIWEGYNASGSKIKSGTVPSSSISTSTTKVITISTQTGSVTTETKSVVANAENSSILNTSAIVKSTAKKK